MADKKIKLKKTGNEWEVYVWDKSKKPAGYRKATAQTNGPEEWDVQVEIGQENPYWVYVKPNWYLVG